MKSVLICTSYWPQTFVAHHALSLRTWKPCILSLVRTNDAYANELKIAGVSRQALSLNSALFDFFGFSSAVSHLMNTTKPKLVHVHFMTVAAAMLPFLKKAALPFVVSAHGYDATSERFANPLVEWVMRTRLQEVFTRAELVLCVSNYIRECVIKKGCPPENALTH
jgi:colanic acid/amylovoran biosynthesis glycosyltransferase